MQNKGKKFLSDLKLHSDYLKWQDDKDRYETWEEACESIIDGHKQQYADKLTELQPYLDSALESMKNKSVLASQRNLQYRYPQIKKENARLYNCLGKETKFITKKGVFSFKDFEDGDIVEVWTHKGRWKQAKVRNFGKQQLNKITFKRGDIISFVRATENHNWKLQNGDDTTNIQIGDTLIKAKTIFDFNYDDSNDPSVGFFISNESDLTGELTNYGTRSNTVKFQISNVMDEKLNKLYKVLNIEKDLYEEVWCLEVEDDHSFTLPNGIVTGNCVSTHCSRNRVFQEVFFLGLCGCGCGISLLKPFVKHLSKIEKRLIGTKTYVINDSISGWADALGVLLSSYFVDNQPFPEYAGYEIKFDYSQIRERGAKISGGFKAPGSAGLKQSLENIEKLLENWIEKESNTIRPILAFDILCYSADSVLSGGIRRSALNMLVDPNDQEMIHAKIGNWRAENPQRARSNNSVLLRRKDVTKEEFEKIVHLNNGDSDIGFAFVNSWFDLYNPCFTGDSKILLEDGYHKLEDLDENKFYAFVTPLGDITNGYVKLSGYKPVIDLKFTNGKVITCTPDHVFMTSEGEEIQAKNSKGKSLKGIEKTYSIFNDEYVKYGFIQGDGALSRLKSESHKGIEVFFNSKDSEVADLFGVPCKQRSYLSGYNEILKELEFSSDTLPTRVLPKTINSWTKVQLLSFLRGIWSANGCFIKSAGRISLKSTCKEFVEELGIVLSKFGIKSYYTTNKPKSVQFKNGNYVCKESYDLNITQYESVSLFMNTIGFIQSYKNDIAFAYLKKKSPRVSSIKNSGMQLVYDFELDDMVHYGIVEGVASHNCFEISKLPVLVDTDFSKIEYDEIDEFVSNNFDKFGIQACNLTEINAEKCTTKEKFLKSCKDAAILGTLQAGYTEFPYLGKVSEEIVRREALLGVSVTGWMNNPKLFNPELLKEGANLVKTINKEVAKIIGINPAARTTTTKPSGNACTKISTEIKTELGVMSMLEVFVHCTNNIKLVNDVLIDNPISDSTLSLVNLLKVYDENDQLKNITGLYVNGIQEVYNIEFDDGEIYGFTGNHKLKTINGWKFVKDLTNEDEIVSF